MTIFGIHTNAQNKTLSDLRDVWRRAEAMGYEWISISDHFPGALGAMSNEAVATHAALAATTTRARCGVLCYSIGFRHPAVLATAVTTIDHLSGGRAAIGIGSGSVPRDYEMYGFDFPPLKTRTDMFDEAVHCVTALLREESVDFEGEHYRLNGAAIQPRPVQERLPVWVGTGGEKRGLRIAARYADGWNSPAEGPESFARKHKVLDAHCEEVGRDPAGIACSVNPTLMLGRDISAMPEARRAAILGGSLEQVLNQIGAYVEGGADQINFFLPFPWPYDELEQLAEALKLTA